MKVMRAQAQWFRLKRSGLVDRFATAEDTAHRLVGIQAQLPAAAHISLWNRTAKCKLADLEHKRLEKRSLVRFWGQRNTVHLYRTADWPFLHTALAERPAWITKFKKAGLLGEFTKVVRRIEKRLRNGDELTYKDIKAKALTEKAQTAVPYVTFMQLVRDGVVCFGADGFVHRTHWVAGPWDPPSADEALPELARRYLAAYGPAEARDLAYWFGTSAAKAKQWIAAAGCAAVDVDGTRMWCNHDDVDELREQPGRWPIRLLYRYDPLLLATKDKSWLIDEQHYKKVWKPAAHVDPVILHRGRIAATWRYDRKGKRLDVTVAPFKPLPKTVLTAAKKEAAAIAKFMGLELGRFA